MTRRHLLALPALCWGWVARARTTEAYDDLRDKILEVEKHWDQFVRQFFGCPATGEATETTCSLGRAVTDYAAFARWWKAAKKLAQVKDCD